MRTTRIVLLHILVSLALVSCGPAMPALVTPAASASQPEPVSEITSGMTPFLDDLAEDTWAYLSSDWATTNHMPWSWRSDQMVGGDYANTAEIGLHALAWLAAYDLQRPWSPTWSGTEAEVLAVLDQLRAWQSGSQQQQPHGPNAYQNSVFYQWYWISWDPPVVGGGSDDRLVPSIDNAWLAASLITIREYARANGHPIMAAKADEILSNMDLMLWYHLDSHLFSWGDVEDPRGGTMADYYSNENRIINFVTRSLGQMSGDEYRNSLAALVQDPASYDGVMVEKVAWDGSYFTYGTPALFIREMDTTYGSGTITPAAQAQIAYTANLGYDAWGLSDCFDVADGPYVGQGAPPTGMTGSPESRPGLVTPHASALALITPMAPNAITNLQTISDTFDCAYDDVYGFRDAVMASPAAPDHGQCSYRFSALAQLWTFLAIANHDSGFIWEYFYRDAGVVTAHDEMVGMTHVYFPLITKRPQ